MAYDRIQRGSTPGPISVGGVVAVVVIAMFCALLAFTWTIESSPDAGGMFPVSRRAGRSDPDPGWGSRARAMLSQERYEELAESGRNRVRSWGFDPEGWLFTGLAFEAMARRPGLDAIEARARADRVWRGLLLRAEPWRAYAGPDGIVDWEAFEDSGGTPRGRFARPYYAGWALAGLGRAVEARERFRRFAFDDRWRVGRGGPFYCNNKACYLALAGEGDLAMAWWALAIDSERVDIAWSEADPDLEIIRADPLFEGLLLFSESGTRRVLTTERGGPRPAPPRIDGL